ncbi:toll/interleukin-1 receptor domain-containing protein [Aquincola sp. S2]|uniref:Toll/interleukin-1 receptor domain-containing protein n=1 Tax=Pseudaquabacterium terrae TaxID=2732868 RepID=A0ABX2ES06_9BURK|nr:toll/interleukin-1 receptor domain-containing protein [Aquabacterium terrae]NRF71446.1 toll/interleukin-1 receptor domain-containing protein [Aquabacterium terrae]
MKVFVSWSGELAQDIAGALSVWLKRVNQRVDCFFSPEHIHSGRRWSTTVASELESCSFGILCLTRQNMRSPWIHFEAGALSKSVEEGRVCPIVFDGDTSDIEGPLSQFQAITFGASGVKKLVKDINGAMEKESLPETFLWSEFEDRWPSLERDIQRILATHRSSVGGAHEPTARELLVEIHSAVVGVSNGMASRSRTGLHLGEAIALSSCLEALGEIENALRSRNDADLLLVLRRLYAPLRSLFDGVEITGQSAAGIEATFNRLDQLLAGAP